MPTEIDFDALWYRVYRPVLTEMGYEAVRADRDVGALIISVLNNGLQIMSIPQEWQNVILGCVILVAVYADRMRKGETSA